MPQYVYAQTIVGRNASCKMVLMQTLWRPMVWNITATFVSTFFQFVTSESHHRYEVLTTKNMKFQSTPYIRSNFFQIPPCDVVFRVWISYIFDLIILLKWICVFVCKPIKNLLLALTKWKRSLPCSLCQIRC